MGQDIFDFWRVGVGELNEHPKDKALLSSLAHNFNLSCLMWPFTGPLRKAPVVLWFRSPGFAPFDVGHAQSPEGQALYLHQRNGYCDLPCKEEHPTFQAWAEGKLKQFDLSYDEVKSKVCFANLAPYKSDDFRNPSLLQKLPSCLAMIDWVHASLVPEAKRGDKVVV